MDECKEITELQWQELDEPLSSSDQQVMSNHLDTCTKCSQYRKKLHFVRDELIKEGMVPLSRKYKMSVEAAERIKARLSADSK